jgi:IMP dehydrogenase
MEARDEYAKRTGNFASIIADGGIRDSGDIVKALGVGADAVMVGGLFAGTDEAPGNLMQMMMSHGDVHYMKQYRGMASLKAQESWKGYAASVEGESTYVPYKGSVKGVLERLVGGVLSGMSYQNALSLGELRSNSRFIRITPAGLQESGPHGK